MNTLNVNLVPRKRRAARRVRTCLRAWAAFGVAYIVFVIGACALMVAAMTPPEDPIHSDPAGLAAQIASAKEKLAESRTKLAAISRQLAGAREVQGHPDWSVLLSLIAARRGDDLALSSVELRPAGAATNGTREAPAGLVARPTSYSLVLTGLGKDHNAVAQFALRLELEGLFSQVVLKDTVARQLATRSVVSFGIECTLRDGAGMAGAEK